jgi:hypothetical protein
VGLGYVSGLASSVEERMQCEYDVYHILLKSFTTIALATNYQMLLALEGGAIRAEAGGRPTPPRSRPPPPAGPRPACARRSRALALRPRCIPDGNRIASGRRGSSGSRRGNITRECNTKTRIERSSQTIYNKGLTRLAARRFPANGSSLFGRGWGPPAPTQVSPIAASLATPTLFPILTFFLSY